MSNALILKRFKELGFSTNEVKSYLSLLERDTLSVTEVAKSAKIPRSNAYESLENLLIKGFCVSIPGSIKRYAASDPQLLKDRAIRIAEESLQVEIENHEKKKKEILSRNKIILEDTHKIIEEVAPLYNQNRDNDSPLDSIEICNDRYQTVGRYNQLSDNAKEELLTIEKPIGTWVPPDVEYDELVSSGVQSMASKLKRGVKARGIYELSDESEKERREYQIWVVNSYYQAGEEIRIAKEVPLRVATIDSNYVAIAMEDRFSLKPAFASIIIHHYGLAKAIKLLFDSLWAEAEDFGDFIKREKQKNNG